MKKKYETKWVPENKFRNGWQIGFVFAAIFLMLFIRKSEAIQNITLVFTAIILEAMPFMMVGALISGLIEVFISRETLIRLLPKNHLLRIGVGAGLGLFLPICECAIIPVVRRFIRKGMPIGVGIAFLLGGPIVNPVVAISTAAAYQFDWKIVLIRVIAGYSIAVLVGWIMERVLYEKELLKPGMAIPDDACEHSLSGKKGTTVMGKLQHAVRHAALDFYDVGRFFIIGAFLAAILQTIASRQGVVDVLSQSPMLNIVAMMVLAFLLNLCSEADAFVAASFAGMISLAGQMAFMVLGPMLDMKLLITYLGVFKKSSVFKLIGLVILLVLLLMIGLDVVVR